MTALFELAAEYRAVSDKLHDLDMDEQTIAGTFGMKTIRHRLAPKLVEQLHPKVAEAFEQDILGKLVAMEMACVKPPRQEGQPDLLPEESKRDRLDVTRCDNKITIKRGERVLVALLADHNNRCIRKNRLPRQFFDVATDSSALRTDCRRVEQNQVFFGRRIHSPSILPYYAGGTKGNLCALLSLAERALSARTLFVTSSQTVTTV